MAVRARPLPVASLSARRPPAGLWAAVALCGLLAAACEPMYGPAPPGRARLGPPGPPPVDDAFRASDFAWSEAPGRNVLSGALGHAGPIRYTCAGLTVVATPETPWARKRMLVLYKSDQRAALPADDVRSRQNQAPPGDSDPFVRRAKCDATDHFVFSGLPDGAWYLVTLAKPAAGQSGPNLAVMRRVVTHGGKVTAFEL